VGDAQRTRRRGQDAPGPPRRRGSPGGVQGCGLFRAARNRQRLPARSLGDRPGPRSPC
jgi:hypothetical protein